MRVRWMRIAAMAMATTTLVAVAACGGNDSSSGGATSTAHGGTQSLAGKQGVFVIFEPALKAPLSEAFGDPAEKATGVKLTYDLPTDYTKLETQVESGNVSWTVVEADAWWAEGHCGTLVEPVDHITVPGLNPAYSSGRCGVSAGTFAYMPLYDSKLFGDDPPKTWADFFDTDKYPGKRAIWGGFSVSGILEGALLADGVPRDQLYPLDLDRAFKKLDTIRDSLTYYDSLAQSVEIMQSHNAAMIAATNVGGYTQSLEDGSFRPMWDGSLLSWDAYIVPKGADMDVADAILTQVADPKNQARLAEVHAGIGPATSLAKPRLKPNQEIWNPAGTGVSPDGNQSLSVPMDQQYYAKHFDEVSARWTEWISG